MAQRLKYSEEAMNQAVNAVKNGTMTAFRAHKIFNVPRTTIIDKVSGRSPIPRQIGITTILSRQEDNLLVKWILYLADSGFPVCKEQQLDSVEMLIKQLKRPNTFKVGRP